MILVDIVGYALAASVAFSGTTGARLNNTGEVQAAGRAWPLPVLLLTILFGVSGSAGILYFSWAHLNWPHIVAFFVVWLTLASPIARVGSRPVIWSAFVLSVLIASASEIFLLIAT